MRTSIKGCRISMDCWRRMNNKNKKPLLPQQSLKDRQRKFAELLRAKQAETKARAAREQQERERIGYKMPDGTIYAGVSPYTGNPMYTTPGDAPLTMAFDDAALYGARLDANGHKD